MATIFVKKGATGSADGTSWEDAYDEINDASPSATDELWVCEGTYTDTPVVLVSDTFCYGGFANTLTGTNGSVVGRTGTDISIINAAGSGRCVTVDDDTHIDGFTVQNGSDGSGGAINASNVDDVVIDNCIFDSNDSSFRGGAWYISGGTGWEVSDCTFSNSEATSHCGGVYYTSQEIDFTDCVWDANETSGSTGQGANLYFGSGAYGTILRGEVKNGVSAYASGEQVFIESSSVIALTNFTVHTSSLTGVYLRGGSVTWNGGDVYDNTIRGIRMRENDTVKNLKIYGNGNNGYRQGGGIYVGDAAEVVIENCLIYGNETGHEGGGIGLIGSGSDATITNCTIADNEGPGSYNAIYLGSGTTATITNCICWDNETGEISSGATVNYSDVEGGYGTGTGNINVDPNFSEGDDGRPYYQPDTTSTAMTGASNGSMTSADILGDAWRDDTMGCYNLVALPTGVILCDSSLTTGSEDGSSWEDAYQSVQDAIDACSGTPDTIWAKARTETLSATIDVDQDCTILGGFGTGLTGMKGTVAGRTPGVRTTLDGDDTYRIFTVLSYSTFDAIKFENGSSSSGGAINMNSSTAYTITCTDCVFDDNASTGNGSAIYYRNLNSGTNAELTIDNCEFINNSAVGNGTVWLSHYGYLTVTDTVFGGSVSTGNSAVRGGAIRMEMNAAVPTSTFDRCVFDYNTATTSSSGAVSINTAIDATFTQCVFSNSTSSSYGSAVSTNGGVGTFDTCLFHDNSCPSGYRGCTVIFSGGTGYLNNCTFADNDSNNGTVGNVSGTVSTINSCYYDNSATNEFYNTVTVTYCNVEGGYTGTGNINVDPNFTGSGDHPYQPDATSDMITEGSNGDMTDEDILGDEWLDDTMGCYNLPAAEADTANALFWCNF